MEKSDRQNKRVHIIIIVCQYLLYYYIFMSSIQESDLLKIRSMGSNDPHNLREIAVRIYDKKMKSFLLLDSKEEVLENCQELLINKTIDYMNVITQLQTGQLKSLNTLNDLLDQKNNIIGNLNSTLAELRQTNKQQSITINFLSKDIEIMKLQLSQLKSRMQAQYESHSKVVMELQKKQNLLRSEYFQVKSNLEASNKQLFRNLQQKTQELKVAYTNWKLQVANLKANKQKEVMELARRHKQAISDYQRNKQDITKQRKYLLDLLQVKDDQILQAKKQKPKVVINKKLMLQQGGRMQVTIRPVEVQITPRIRSKSKVRVEKSKKQQQKKQENRKLDKTEKVEKIQKKDFGIQCNESLTNSRSPKVMILKSDTAIQTMMEDPLQNIQTTEVEQQLKNFLDQQYKAIYDTKLKQITKKYSQQYKKALGEAKTLIFQLSSLTKDQIKLANIKFLQMEQFYQQRPSREQDLDYIIQLMQQNRSLVLLCNQANQKTDSAYIALQEYHSKLQSYKKLVQVNINGTVPPQQIHSIKDFAKNGRTQSIKSLRAFNSNTSFGAGFNSEPNTSRKLTRCLKLQDETFDATMKDVLATDFDLSELGSPLKKKSIIVRPQTGKILSIRKKSGAC